MKRLPESFGRKNWRHFILFFSVFIMPGRGRLPNAFKERKKERKKEITRLGSKSNLIFSTLKRDKQAYNRKFGLVFINNSLK